MNNDKQIMICWHLFSELPMNIICFSSCVHPSLVSTENNRKKLRDTVDNNETHHKVNEMVSWGCRKLEISWGRTNRNGFFSPLLFSESTNWTCLWVYMPNTPYMSALCEQGMIYLHTNTHIFIYVQTFVMGGSLLSWGCRKLEISWG